MRKNFQDRIEEAQQQKNMLYAVEKTLPREIAKVLLNNKEFKDSIRGENGEVGIAGMNGDDGLMGPRGLKGDTGPQGPAGKDGKDGKDGVNGKDGINGKDNQEMEGIEDGKLSYNFLRNTPDIDKISRRVAAEEIIRRRVTAYLKDMADVDASNLINGSILTWNSAKSLWVVGAATSNSFRVVQTLVPGANIITHNLANSVIMVEVRDNTTGDEISVMVGETSANTCTITVLSSVASARITIKN